MYSYWYCSVNTGICTAVVSIGTVVVSIGTEAAVTVHIRTAASRNSDLLTMYNYNIQSIIIEINRHLECARAQLLEYNSGLFTGSVSCTINVIQIIPS